MNNIKHNILIIEDDMDKVPYYISAIESVFRDKIDIEVHHYSDADSGLRFLENNKIIYLSLDQRIPLYENGPVNDENSKYFYLQAKKRQPFIVASIYTCHPEWHIATEMGTHQLDYLEKYETNPKAYADRILSKLESYQSHVLWDMAIKELPSPLSYFANEFIVNREKDIAIAIKAIFHFWESSIRLLFFILLKVSEKINGKINADIRKKMLLMRGNLRNADIMSYIKNLLDYNIYPSSDFKLFFSNPSYYISSEKIRGLRNIDAHIFKMTRFDELESVLKDNLQYIVDFVVSNSFWVNNPLVRNISISAWHTKNAVKGDVVRGLAGRSNKAIYYWDGQLVIEENHLYQVVPVFDKQYEGMICDLYPLAFYVNKDDASSLYNAYNPKQNKYENKISGKPLDGKDNSLNEWWYNK